eukprot:scaffold1988_cov255-Pinguiococcus_pyrenoidosus.AAC.17
MSATRFRLNGRPCYAFVASAVATFWLPLLAARKGIASLDPAIPSQLPLSSGDGTRIPFAQCSQNLPDETLATGFQGRTGSFSWPV